MRGGKVDFRNTFFKNNGKSKEKMSKSIYQDKNREWILSNIHFIVWDKTNGQITYFCASNLQKGQIFARDM